jgi:ribosome-binding protein aMBF1 (putative translation factor)
MDDPDRCVGDHSELYSDVDEFFDGFHGSFFGFLVSLSAARVTLASMTRRRSAVGPPCKYVEGSWPTGPAKADAPRALEHARAIAIRLAAALEGRAVTDVAERADLARSTVYDLVNGASWPDLISLGKLEAALDIDLLPPLPERDGVS